MQVDSLLMLYSPNYVILFLGLGLFLVPVLMPLFIYFVATYLLGTSMLLYCYGNNCWVSVQYTLCLKDLDFIILAEKVDTVLGSIKRTFFQAYRTIMHSRIHYEHDEILNREKSELITRMR